MRFLFLLLLLSILTITPVLSQDFIVNEFTADFYLREEGYVDVVENYEIEFLTSKHGVYRDIVTKYDFAFNQNGEQKIEKREIIISEIDVLGWKFSAPKTSKSVSQRYSDYIRIKIGDAKVTVNGIQHYEIKYKLENAFIFTEDLVQFYWNVKPDNWDTKFNKIVFRVHTPKGAELSSDNCFVYSGAANITNPSTDFINSFQDTIFSSSSVDDFVSWRGEFVTVLMKLPRELITEIDYTLPWWKKYSWVAVLAAIVAFLWSKFKGTMGLTNEVVAVTSYYPPEKMDPAMAGYVIDDTADGRDVVSLLPYWAVNGVITIKEIPKKGVFGSADMELTKLKSLPEGSTEYESILFDELFKSGDQVFTSSLKDSFYLTFDKAKKSLGEKAGVYYDGETNTQMTTLGCTTLVVSVAIGFAFYYFYGIMATVISSLLIFVLGVLFFKKKKSQRGNEAFSELLGFRQFIKLAEVNRIKVLLKDDPEYFEKTMSYAVAFGLLKQWTSKFDALDIKPPDWYSSTSGLPITMAGFGNSFDSSLRGTQSYMVSSPSSSGGGSGGGGSSGGGFGGGGGGSW